MSSTPVAPLLLRVEEAADRLGIGRSLMYHLALTGAVESVTVGRLRRIPGEALEEYVRRLREDVRRISEAIDGQS